jgi:hypothetical protein
MKRRAAIALVAGLWLLFFEPVWLRGHVIAAHDNRPELGLAPNDADRSLQARALSDQTSVTLPELAHHLQGERSGWLATWNPHTQLGRPSIQVAGMSLAYLPNRLIALAATDPLQLYTAEVALHSAGAAVFGFALFSELGLAPLACAAGAISLSIGCFSAFWLCFGMFIAGHCWTAALLLGIARLARGAGLGSALLVALSTHLLLLSAYPQQIVWHAWIALGFSAIAIHTGSRTAPRVALRRAATLGCAVGIGAASVLPVYADLWLTASRSARAVPTSSFFLAALPDLAGTRALRFLALHLEPFGRGNPLAVADDLPFEGVSLTPPLALFALAGLSRAGWRRAAAPLAFCVAAALLIAHPPLYAFALRWLGLGLSRYSPLAGAWIPAVTLSALGVDALLRGRAISRPALAAVAGSIALVISLGWALAAAPVSPIWIATSLALLACAALISLRPQPLLVAGLLSAVVLGYSLPLRLMRPSAEVARSSPLSAALADATLGGGRYAIVAAGAESPTPLPPNQEAWLGLRSIHSYDSLSSLAYQSFSARISSRGATTLGRFFRSLDARDPIAREELALAGVRTLVWTSADPSGAASHAEVELRPAETPAPLERQWLTTPIEFDTASVASLPALPIARIEDRSDHLRFRLTPVAEPSLLFVSQQFHPHWRARVDSRELATRALRGFYLGVEIPPETREVALEFRPWARHAWIPHWGFGLASALFAVWRLCSSRRADPSPAANPGSARR